MACQAQYTPDTTKKNQIFSSKDNSANYSQVTNMEQLENIKKFRIALDKQDYEAITKLINALDSTKKNHDQVLRIISDLLLSQKMLDLAVSTLKKIKKHNKDDYQSVAHACAQLSDHKCATEALFDYINSSESEQLSLTSNTASRLWNHLLASAEETYNQRPNLDRELILFSKAFVKSDSIEKKQELWLKWKNSNSSHSFALKPPLALRLVENFSKPNIAVILPLSGDFQAAGKAVRNGIVTSSFGESKRLRGTLNFYDSEAQSMSSILKLITQGNTTHVIGPLLKENCRVFTQISKELSKPILLLNYLSEDIEKSKHQYSLGLSIEHEVDSLLEEITQQALNNILIVSNASSWAVRSKNLFEDEWLKTVTNAKFENPRDITESISKAVGVEASNSRKESIDKIMGKPLEFLPRTRKDIDAIIAFVSPSESESLEPILKFHFLEDRPVFASSQSELHNYQFRELTVRSLEFPFIGQNNNPNVFLKDQFELRTRFDQELFALGMDAYKLLQLIEIFRVTPGLTVHGQTGLVKLGKKQNFFRKLKLIKNEN
tara:strand:+ start:2412 stop:4058 length:1647 start_codon:yes stop_codon:yes gene_type:complete